MSQSSLFEASPEPAFEACSARCNDGDRCTRPMVRRTESYGMPLCGEHVRQLAATGLACFQSVTLLVGLHPKTRVLQVAPLRVAPEKRSTE